MPMQKSKRNKTFFHIYWGNGRGKTSCAAGTLIRDYFHFPNKNYLWIQFFKKGPLYSGETAFLYQNLKNLEFYSVISELNIWEYKNISKNLIKIRKSFQDFWQNKEKFTEKIYQLIILDEFLDVFKYNLLDISESIMWLTRLKANDIIITGHEKVEKLFEIGNYITYFKMEKHPYIKYIRARKGIEF